MAFDPDAFLGDSGTVATFDPDAFLAEGSQPSNKVEQPRNLVEELHFGGLVPTSGIPEDIASLRDAESPFLRAAQRGWIQGEVAMEMQKASPDTSRIAQLQTESQQFSPSQGFLQTWSDQSKPEQSWDAFSKDPVGVVGELVAEALGTQARTGMSFFNKIPERATQGLMTGAIIGSVAPTGGITTAIGGKAGLVIGANVGFSEMNMLASHAAEYSGSIIQSLQEEGIDVSNRDQLQAAFQDTEKMNRFKAKAQKKAVPIAIIDGFMTVIGGKIFSSPAKKVIGKVGQWATELGVQAAGGAGGEALSQMTSEGKVTSPRSIIAEAVAEPVTSIGEVAIGKITQSAFDRTKGETKPPSTPPATTPLSPIKLGPPIDPKVSEVEKEIKIQAEAITPKKTKGLDEFIQTGEITGPDTEQVPTESLVEGDERFAPPAVGEIAEPVLSETITKEPTDAITIQEPEAPNGSLQPPEITQENAQLSQPESGEGIPPSGQTQEVAFDFDTSLIQEINQGTLDKIAGRLNIPEQDRADFAQNVSLKALESRNKFDPEKGNFRTWLNRIAERTWVDQQRSEGAEKRGKQVTGSLEEPISPESETPLLETITGPEELSASVREDAKNLRNLISELDEKDTQLIQARIEGATWEELASQFGMESKQAAQQRFKRLRSQLRREAEQRFGRDFAENYSRQAANGPVVEDAERYGPGASNVSEWRERNFLRRFVEDEEIDSDIKDILSEASRQYIPITNKDTVDEMNQKIAQNGIIRSANQVMAKLSSLEWHQRVTLGQIVLKRLNEAIKKAKLEGDTQTYSQLLDLSSDLVFAVGDIGTQVGRGVQAFTLWSRLTPEGVILAARKQLAKSSSKKAKNIAVKTDSTRKKLNEENEVAFDKLTKDKEAINEAKSKAPKKKRGSKSYSVNLKGDTSIWDLYKDSAAKRLIREMSPKKEGEESSGPALEDFTNRLTRALRAAIPRTKGSTDIAGLSDLEILSEAVNNYDKYMAVWQSVLQGAGEGKEAQLVANEVKILESLYSKALREQLDINGIVLSEIARRKYSDARNAASDIVEVTEAILGENTSGIAAVVERKFLESVKQEKIRILESMLESLGKREKAAIRNKKSFIEKVIELSNLGAMDNRRYESLLEEALGISSMTPKDVSLITRLAEEASEAPEGFLQNEKSMKVAYTISKIDGISATEVANSLWYANILSGLGTHFINLFASAVNGTLNVVNDSVTSGNYRDIFAMFEGMGRAAFGISRKEAQSVLFSDSQILRFESKFQARVSPLTLIRTENPMGVKERTKNFISYGQYIFRALQAEDAYLYRTFSEGRAYMSASKAARSQDGNYRENLLNQLGMTPEFIKSAYDQASAEVEKYGESATQKQKDRDTDRRAFEIMESKRSETIRTDSDRFASISTYNFEPEGVLGQVARAMNFMIKYVTIPTPAGDLRPLTPIVPFVNIVANVANTQLDYTPIGFIRAIRGTELTGKTQDSRQEQIRRAVQATIGTGLFAISWGLAEAGMDEKDPWYTVYGEGPKDLTKKRQLMSQGWKPFSIKIGNFYLRYNETPLSMPFAVLGGYLDARRYGGSFNRKNMAEKAAYGIGLSLHALSEASFLSGIMDFFKILDGETSVEKFIIRSLSGFIPGQGILRDVSKIFDPEIKDQEQGWWVGFVANLPVAKSIGTQPMLNAFGEAVEYNVMERIPGISRVISIRTSHPEFRYLADNNLMIPGLGRPISVNAAGLKKRQKYRLEQIRLERAETVGQYAAGYFTQEEQYNFIKKTGPKIKQLIRNIMEANMDPADAQDRIEKEVALIRSAAKKEILGL